MTRLLPYWPYLAALLLACAALALAFRSRVMRLVRVAKALSTDKRLPVGVRWMFRIGLVAKCLPVDFGVDEVLLGLASVIVLVFYRDEVRAIVRETGGASS